MNSRREPPTEPLIKLGEEFKEVNRIILVSIHSLYSLESRSFGICIDFDFIPFPLLLFSSLLQLSDYERRFRTVPDILELDHLTVSGDVYFGANVTLKVPNPTTTKSPMFFNSLSTNDTN